MTLPNLSFMRPRLLLLLVAAAGVVVVALHPFAGRGAPPAARPGGGLPNQFVEVAEKSGIHFTLTSGGPEKRYIIEAKGGGGVAWIDYD